MSDLRRTARHLPGLAALILSAGLALLPVRSGAAPQTGAAAAAAEADNAEPHPALDRIRARGKVIMAHRDASIPFSYLDHGKPVGYAMDLCLKIVDALRKHTGLHDLGVEYLEVKPATRIAAIVEGRADFECGATTNNAERREKVAFTVPHYITGARYAVPAASTIETLEQFEGHKLVSTTGTTPLKAVDQANRDRLLHIQVLTASDHDKAFDMVVKGQADGFVMDDIQLYGQIAQQPDPSRYKVVGKFLTIEPLAIMLPKGDPVLKRIADNEMKRLIRSGEAEAIYQRWFLKPIPPRQTSLNLPMNHLLRDFWKYPSDQVPF